MPTLMDVDATLLNDDENQVWMDLEDDIMEDRVLNCEYRLLLPNHFLLL